MAGLRPTQPERRLLTNGPVGCAEPKSRGDGAMGSVVTDAGCVRSAKTRTEPGRPHAQRGTLRDCSARKTPLTFSACLSPPSGTGGPGNWSRLSVSPTVAICGLTDTTSTILLPGIERQPTTTAEALIREIGVKSGDTTLRNEQIPRYNRRSGGRVYARATAPKHVSSRNCRRPAE
jgi:hypothetical protein